MTLEHTDERRVPRLAGNQGRYRATSPKTRALVRKGKERHVKSLTENVASHIANYLRPAYRSLKELHSKPAFWVSAI